MDNCNVDELKNELAIVKQDRDDSKQMVLLLTAMVLKIIELGEDKTLQDAKDIIDADMKQLSEACFRTMHPEENLFSSVVSKIHN
ncbi:hypothetical protein [Clostridium sp. JS66]|uniref:hypothetical protein n=1 Tax=Clostridium sp. JS66 TaxID=3064705 RepID=UPI00298DCD59|nr:hypothetical protein [Clostridium sp. JS66]WPC42932.1 hypothetical protein Q6H37_05525 [Clostridium sp. JS66]